MHSEPTRLMVSQAESTRCAEGAANPRAHTDALRPRPSDGWRGLSVGRPVQWLVTAFSAPAPVKERTSISANFASLCSFEVIVPM